MKNGIPLLLDGYKDGLCGLDELEQLCSVYDSISSRTVYGLLSQEKNKCLSCVSKNETVVCDQCKRNTALRDLFKQKEDTK